MSVHLIECAAEIVLRPAEKLVLLCFADSGSNDGRVALPGLDAVMTWSGLGRSQALAVVRRLVELRLLARRVDAGSGQVVGGHRGQRAEFVVFPLGCCDRHGKAPAGPVDDDQAAADAGW